MKKKIGKLLYLKFPFSNPNVRLYKIGCKCMTALLTVTETRLKRQEKKFVQNSLRETTGDIELYGNFYRHAI